MTETTTKTHGQHGHRSHARRSKAGETEIPQPSFAERTRTLLVGQQTGYLSSHSRHQEGFPFGSVMPYALDASGRPLMLISKMAMHTQNLDQDARASLLVPGEGAAKDPLGAGRVTLLGHGEPVPADDLDAARELYLERHPKAGYWIDYADFGLYRLEVSSVYFVGGFGVMGWVEVADYSEAAPDPLVDVAAGIIEHMNDDHADALQLLAAGVIEGTSEAAVEEATMTAVDRLGFHLRVKVGERYHGCRVPFTREVRNSEETRTVMVEMVRAARG